jgi:very-short-patch-repair endonuclease
MLVEWWCKQTKKPSNDAEARSEFGKRLQASLQSEAERVFLANYFRVFKPILEDNLPALLPQVYLHYDPRSRGERSKQVLVRQRMDFLILLANAARIVIEIDGIQHYSDDNGRASPSRYAEMVAEDRRIRNLGYEVYRFGGSEIVAWNGEKFVALDTAKETITSFFQELFTRHAIKAVLESHSKP